MMKWDGNATLILGDKYMSCEGKQLQKGTLPRKMLPQLPAGIDKLN